MTTVAQIAARAFNGVSARITDAVLNATVTRDVQGAYDVATGQYAATTTTQTGRVVIDTDRGEGKPVKDIFPAYTIGPRDQLFIVDGITSLQEADRITAGGKTYAVGPVQDIVGAGTLFYCIAQEVPT